VPVRADLTEGASPPRVTPSSCQDKLPRNREEADLFFLLGYLSSKVRNENSAVS
jgi:hypothetical protein